jgi:serine O-acetyltransferase
MTAGQCLHLEHDRFSSVRAGISADIQRYLTKSPHDVARGNSFKRRLSALLTPEVLPVFLYRIAHYLNVKRWRRLAMTVARINELVHKVHITPQSCIGPGFRLPHPVGVTFNGQAGHGLTVYTTAVCCSEAEGWDAPLERAPTLGNNVTIDGHAVVLGKIQIGDGTTVVCSVRLSRSAPAGVLVASKARHITIRRS